MKLSAIEQRLVDAMAKLEIVDAHEHLPPEKEYLSFDYCGPNFFAGYTWHDLENAGMPLEFKRTMRDPGHRAVEDWWPQIAPYWPMVKDGSYARAIRITARDLYGIDDINDTTVHDLADKIRADNHPGIYEEILRDRCNIRLAITCQPHTRFQDDPIIRTITLLEPDRTWTADALAQYAREEETEIRTLDDFAAADAARLARMKSEGAVGFKTMAVDRTDPSPGDARAVFQSIAGSGRCDRPQPLADYLFWRALEAAAALDLPVAVHAGLWDDFRKLDPTWMIPGAMRCPDTHFDLFHLGLPYVRDAAVIGKNFPNVSLNLCWCYVMSQRMTLRTIDEIIDLVPLNKIIAFGADYRCVVQKIYGHLVMARETLARAFGRRIEDGDFSEDRALEIAKLWLCDNPARIYNV